MKIASLIKVILSPFALYFFYGFDTYTCNYNPLVDVSRKTYSFQTKTAYRLVKDVVVIQKWIFLVKIWDSGYSE